MANKRSSQKGGISERAVRYCQPRRRVLKCLEKKEGAREKRARGVKKGPSCAKEGRWALLRIKNTEVK